MPPDWNIAFHPAGRAIRERNDTCQWRQHVTGSVFTPFAAPCSITALLLLLTTSVHYKCSFSLSCHSSTAHCMWLAIAVLSTSNMSVAGIHWYYILEKKNTYVFIFNILRYMNPFLNTINRGAHQGCVLWPESNNITFVLRFQSSNVHTYSISVLVCIY